MALLRPATLWAAAAPWAVGTALAAADGVFYGPAAACALIGALAIQIGTNLFNDLADFARGADQRRVGPPRLLARGWMAAGRVRRLAWGAFAAATAAGIFLVWRAGWPLVWVGLLSMASGWAYTCGPFPLAYRGLGDVFVFVFFGLVAVTGTYYVQALHLSFACLPAAAAVGALATTILVANNLRDVDGDRRVGKRTVVVALGEAAGRGEFAALLSLAFVMPPLAWAMGMAPPTWLLSHLTAPWAWRAWRTVRDKRGVDLGPALGQAARLEAAFAALLALGIWLGPRLWGR